MFETKKKPFDPDSNRVFTISKEMSDEMFNEILFFVQYNESSKMLIESEFSDELFQLEHGLDTVPNKKRKVGYAQRGELEGIKAFQASALTKINGQIYALNDVSSSQISFEDTGYTVLASGGICPIHKRVHQNNRSGIVLTKDYLTCNCFDKEKASPVKSKPAETINRFVFDLLFQPDLAEKNMLNDVRQKNPGVLELQACPNGFKAPVTELFKRDCLHENQMIQTKSNHILKPNGHFISDFDNKNSYKLDDHEFFTIINNNLIVNNIK